MRWSEERGAKDGKAGAKRQLVLCSNIFLLRFAHYPLARRFAHCRQLLPHPYHDLFSPPVDPVGSKEERTRAYRRLVNLEMEEIRELWDGGEKGEGKEAGAREIEVFDKHRNPDANEEIAGGGGAGWISDVGRDLMLGYYGSRLRWLKSEVRGAEERSDGLAEVCSEATGRAISNILSSRFTHRRNLSSLPRDLGSRGSRRRAGQGGQERYSSLGGLGSMFGTRLRK